MHSALGLLPDRCDLVIIGGGIHGLFASVEAAARGWRTVLVERNRMGSGTTANSLRIVHGGLRYLQQLAPGRMRVSAREQAWLLRRFPDLITPLPVIVPALGRGRRSPEAFRAGFRAAGLLTRDVASPALPPPRVLTIQEFEDRVPWYRHPSLRGGAAWHDALIEDPPALMARLEGLARKTGVQVAEGLTATQILDRAGQVTGVRITDGADVRVLECRGVINAAGPWIGSLAPGSAPTPSRWALAVNLVVPRRITDVAVGIPSPVRDPIQGRRFLFLVPCRDQTLLGTAYRDAETDETATAVAEALRLEWNDACPDQPIAAHEVTQVLSGHLPLNDGKTGARAGSLAARGRVHDHSAQGQRGLVTMVPVKLTTARHLARLAVARAARHLGPEFTGEVSKAGRRILVLAPHPFFQDRGTPIAVKSLVEFLAGQGHQVDLLTYHEGRDLELPGVRHYRIPRIPGIRNIRPGFSLKKVVCDIAMFFSAVRLARRGRYDLVHAVEESVLMAALVRVMSGTPFVYDMDSSLVDQVIEKHPGLGRVRPVMERWLGSAVRQAAGIVAVCPELVQVARRYSAANPVALVQDTTLLDSAAPVAENLREGLPPGTTLLLYVGNLERYQGIDLLLESFALAVRDIRAQLVVIGGHPQDIHRYQQEITARGLRDQVRLIGPRPLAELGGYLRQADILVSPRLTGNNTPMKIFSYLDAGVPVLATRLATHTQVLDERVALLVDPDPAAMAQGMVRLARDQALGTALACEARRLVRREFTPAAARRKLAAFYRQIEAALPEARAS